MQIVRSATSVSWIPSDSIPDLFFNLPFQQGVLHYDPPPPLTITDLAAMRRRGEFRFANELQVWIDVDGGEIRDYGYSGGTIMGLTPITVGSLHVLLPAKGNQEIRRTPRVSGNSVTFVQTAGGRPGFSFVKPSARWPFVATRPYTIWTAIELTVSADGSCSQRLAGASPFPRHWLYDHGGHLVEKAALTRVNVWRRTAFGQHTPWGGHDETPVVAPAETDLERSLAEQIMQAGQRPAVRELHAGDFLFRQADQAKSVVLILDGIFEVQVNGSTVGHAGPGAVVGELASLNGGRRTADLRALTDARVAETSAELLSLDGLGELARQHHREDDNQPAARP